jgi:D-amino-acid dehydrogenase
MMQKQVVVIGAGVIGVSTAYFLAAAGHDVVVIERRGNVAEESSVGNWGGLAPGYSAPSASPGMPKNILSYLFKSESPVLLKPKMDMALWRWIRQWMTECEQERYHVNALRMKRLASYGQEVMYWLQQNYQLDYEQGTGLMQLFRTERELKLAQPALAVLAEANIPHKLLDADGARLIEPSLNPAAPLAGALHFPQDETGNCPLFTKQLKYIAQSNGVRFLFGSTVKKILQKDDRITLRIDDHKCHADAVVVAAGQESAQLLKPLGIDVPLYPIKTYTSTVPIKNFDEAPHASLVDDAYKISMVRMGTRIRIAGIAEMGSQNGELHQAALRTLAKVGDDWFPGAANYHAGTFWTGVRPSLPDGAPLIGATRVKNVFVNIGHGSAGWATAAGSAKLVADLISELPLDIDTEGLTLARYASFQ